jgi:hypothetical protein
MKKTLKLSALALVFVSLCSFVELKKPKAIKRGELRSGETIYFGEKEKDPKTYRVQSARRASYDQSRYSILLDTIGNITASSIKGCQGNHST